MFLWTERPEERVWWEYSSGTSATREGEEEMHTVIEPLATMSCQTPHLVSFPQSAAVGHASATVLTWNCSAALQYTLSYFLSRLFKLLNQTFFTVFQFSWCNYANSKSCYVKRREAYHNVAHIFSGDFVTRFWLIWFYLVLREYVMIACTQLS